MDISHIFKFIIAWPIARIYRHRRRHIWLICEYKDEARDNAYWFFKYLTTEQKHIDAVYAINKKADDYKKVCDLGEIVQYGSFKHWIYYIAAEVNISSQKGGKPNAAVCYVLEVSGIWKNKRVFLQHGIILSELPYLFCKNARLSLITCGAAPEYINVKKYYGYSENSVCYTGMCRFDRLHHVQRDQHLILIVPTWREYVTKSYKKRTTFSETDYFKKWNSLLNEKRLDNILSEYEMKVLFCPHRNMSQFRTQFNSESTRIRILDWQEVDISNIIEKASLLITDYSSISMDFAYMKRPVLYYQFDKERFRNEHLSKSYFDFEDDGFGPVCTDLDVLLNELCNVLEDGCIMNEYYVGRHNRFFPLYDDKNCMRTYFCIKEQVSKISKG